MNAIKIFEHSKFKEIRTIFDPFDDAFFVAF